ncbi:MAG: hypothetical protein HY892_05770, partial [Deltaproteobacteria bacterium]|nr:hypothetical protein [Deltaproteobacteria bacterium]
AGDYDSAIAYYESAAKSNPRYRDDVTFARGVKLGKTIGAEEARNADRKALREKSGKVIDSAFVAWQKRDYDTSILLLQTALSMDPYNQKIQDTIDFVKGVQYKNLKPQRTKKKSQAKN